MLSIQEISTRWFGWDIVTLLILLFCLINCQKNSGNGDMLKTSSKKLAKSTGILVTLLISRIFAFREKIYGGSSMDFKSTLKIKASIINVFSILQYVLNHLVEIPWIDNNDNKKALEILVNIHQKKIEVDRSTKRK